MIRPFCHASEVTPTASSLRKQGPIITGRRAFFIGHGVWVPAFAGTTIFSSRRQLLRREAAVERLAICRPLDQEFRRPEARTRFGLELAAKTDEILCAHEVDVGQRAAGEGGKAEAQDRADVGLARIG